MRVDDGHVERRDHPLVDVNLRDKDGQTALYVASVTGNDEIVKIILEHPDINVNKGRTADGKTPLIVAAEEGHLSTVLLLVGHPKLDINKA